MSLEASPAGQAIPSENWGVPPFTTRAAHRDSLATMRQSPARARGDAAADTSPPPPPRLGRVERAILEELARAGGVIQRDEAVRVLFAATRPPGGRRGGPAATKQRERWRVVAEATLSRAVTSLERKGLIVRERNPKTGRVVLRAAECTRFPEWEEVARGEEDLVEHCRRYAAAWEALARRSMRRVMLLRSERSIASTECERQADMEAISRLEGGVVPAIELRLSSETRPTKR